MARRRQKTAKQRVGVVYPNNVKIVIFHRAGYHCDFGCIWIKPLLVETNKTQRILGLRPLRKKQEAKR